MLWLFRPNLRIDSVVELTPELLHRHSLESLLLDVDCTLKHYLCDEMPPEIEHWLESMKAHRIGLCLVSNGREPRIKNFAQKVGLPFVAPALKPLPLGIRKALRITKFEKKSTAMVGDQVFADMMAGNLAGLFTILVTPLNPEEEPWFARMKRPLEKLVLNE